MQDKVDIAKKHLGEDSGHTEYWQEAADIFNNKLNLKRPITAYITKEEEELLAQPLVEQYEILDFNGF